jgi:hypothetical protein
MASASSCAGEGILLSQRPAFVRHKTEIFESECLEKIDLRVILCLGLESELSEWFKQDQGFTVGSARV